MNGQARKVFYWVCCTLAVIWLTMGGIDIVLDLYRGREIAVIEIVIVLAVGFMIWVVGYVARFVK
jgi:hypothetical protein